MAPARLRDVLRDKGGSPWLLHVSGVYSEMKGGSPWLLHVSGVYSEMRRGHRGSCTSQGCTQDEGGHRGSSTSIHR